MLECDVGDAVAKMVDMNDATDEFAMPPVRRLFKCSFNNLRTPLAELRWRNPKREMRRHRRKDITPVEGAADVGQPVARLGQIVDGAVLHAPLRDCFAPYIRQDAIIGRHVYGIRRRQNDTAPFASHPRINHHYVNRSRRKKRPERLNDIRSLMDVLRRDLMRDVHNRYVARNSQNNSLHNADITIGQPKVGC